MRLRSILLAAGHLQVYLLTVDAHDCVPTVCCPDEYMSICASAVFVWHESFTEHASGLCLNMHPPPGDVKSNCHQ